MPEHTETTVDELIAMIDRLIESGTQHINLEVGENTRIQTVNSTECGRDGACSVPNFDWNDERITEKASDDEEF